MPPRLAITVGIAVATTVDSIAARNTAAITPPSTSPRRAAGVQLPAHQWPPGAARAPAERAEGGVRVEALVAVEPAHPQRLRQLLDLLRPRHLLRERGRSVGSPARRDRPAGAGRTDRCCRDRRPRSRRPRSGRPGARPWAGPDRAGPRSAGTSRAASCPASRGGRARREPAAGQEIVDGDVLVARPTWPRGGGSPARSGRGPDRRSARRRGAPRGRRPGRRRPARDSGPGTTRRSSARIRAPQSLARSPRRWAGRPGRRGRAPPRRPDGPVRRRTPPSAS